MLRKPLRKLSQLLRSRRRKPSSIRNANATESLETRTLLTVDFVFEYTGSIAGSPANIGFNDPTLGAARKAALENTAATLGSWFDHTATVHIAVEDEQANNGGLAYAGGPLVSQNNGFDNRTVAHHKILTGVDSNGAAADGYLGVNWFSNYELGNAASDFQNGEHDFGSTVMHELLHSMGFLAGFQANGTSENGGNIWGVFDQFVADNSGVNIVNSTTFVSDTARFVTAATGGTANGLFFTGPNAKAANNGQAVPLYSPTSGFSSGSSVSHLDDNAPGISWESHVMVAAGQDGARNARELAAVERGILMDLGYSLVAPAAPAGITVDAGDGLLVKETGTTDTFTVVLTAQPTSNVNISVATSDATEFSRSTTSLVFTPDNWNQPQTVTVSGVDDSVLDGLQTGTINLNVLAGSAAAFESVTIPQLAISNVDVEESIVLNGTTGNDSIRFTARTSDFDLSINGTLYRFEGNDPQITIRGNGGVDAVRLQNAATADVVTLGYNNATVENAAYAVTVSSVDNINVYGRGGAGQHHLHCGARISSGHRHREFRLRCGPHV